MSGYKKYYGKNIGVKFFPEQNLIILLPKKEIDPTSFRQMKERIETILDIKGTNLNKRDGQVFFSIKVSGDTPKENIEQVLRGLFHGGDEILTASDLGGEDEEEKEKQQQEQQPPQNPEMPQQPPAPPTQMETWNRLYESTYRTAEYWDVLSRTTGKSKQAIIPEDIISIRKKYTKKPQGKKRDLVLRSLDKALKYFARKMSKNMGPDAAVAFKEKYKMIGNLVPSDYAEDRMAQHVPPPQSSKDDSPEEEFYDDDKIDFSQFFSSQEEDDEEDAYSKYEVET